MKYRTLATLWDALFFKWHSSTTISCICLCGIAGFKTSSKTISMAFKWSVKVTSSRQYDHSSYLLCIQLLYFNKCDCSFVFVFLAHIKKKQKKNDLPQFFLYEILESIYFNVAVHMILLIHIALFCWRRSIWFHHITALWHLALLRLPHFFSFPSQ